MMLLLLLKQQLVMMLLLLLKQQLVMLLLLLLLKNQLMVLTLLRRTMMPSPREAWAFCLACTGGRGGHSHVKQGAHR